VALITVHTNTGECAHLQKPQCACRFLHSSSYILMLVPFLISTIEESSQPTKHANKTLVSIFLTKKGIMILDTHGITIVCNLISIHRSLLNNAF